MPAKITTRTATASDIRSFFGNDVPRTVRARVLERDGEVLAVAGYHIGAGCVVMFSDMKPGIPKMRIWREARRMMSELKLPAVCVAEEYSGPFLERLGWHYAGRSDAGDVYQWQP